MLVPIKWLKDYVDLDIDIKDYVDGMTMSGTKVESVEEVGQNIDKVVVGKIIEITPHPNADSLLVTKVDVGGEILQIITGANNIKVNNYVPVALHGSTLPDGTKIKKGKLRGLESNGMLCSPEELGLNAESFPDGIYILDKEYPLGTDIKKVLGLDDKIVEFEITNNRPDCLSMLGIARETAATFGLKMNYPSIEVSGKDGDVSDYISVDVQATDLCPRFAVRVIKNVEVKSSPAWMQDRLLKAGVRPINNIVDITNYVMLETGQPMHAYDLNMLEGNKIVVRRAKDNEKIVTLDEIERILDNKTLVIADENKAIGIAGIMGGYNSEIKEDTKTIAFEAAIFDSVNVRLSSKKLGIRTEASSRFEKGLDAAMVQFAIDRACHLVEELGAGEVVGGMIDIYPTRKERRIMNLRTERVKWLLGVDIPVDKMKKILESLEFKVSGVGILEVSVPTFRDDVTIEADLIEEIARIYGYDNIPSKLMDTTFTQGGRNEKQRIREIVRDNMTAQGLFETCTYTFVSPSVFNQINCKAENPLRKAIKIINPLGEDQSIMRTTIIPNMLEVISRNYNRKITEGMFYELSKVYLAEELPLKDLAHERDTLIIGIYGDKDFFDLKGIIENLMDDLNITNYRVLPSNNESFHPGRTAELLINNKRIGYLGEIHPDVLDNYDIPTRVYIAELDFEEIVLQTNLNIKYKPLPKYPSIQRDIAVVVSEEITAGQIEEIIRNKGGKLVEEVNLFDIYRGSQIEEGYKSMAYSIIYRSEEKTLTEEDITKVHNKILNSLASQVGAILRS
ncbi:phenylalanine--tRNA ligase subunit beta [Lutispora thermophila]|uniref:Phenylalanine--tRNA ligase beta subunit n=1 Tax=Lutispora thermophila DSM 19022 TaxID=1122184 RepID=A0A1M6GNY0_9FIRM|nr:phenylalanine--tRNA ligase subunit beta [Lutispora thermophila]SHJ11695.1 phenylalanyl-tRNA synthetase beta subunit [Lutispora thermophila DSM 19022]